MKLNSVQLAAAERGGCRFSPASPAEVQRLSMQNRIFWHDGHPFTARSATGFQETAGTLLKLIAQHEQVAAPPRNTPADPAPPATVAAPTAEPPRPSASSEQNDQPSAQLPQVEQPGAPAFVQATASKTAPATEAAEADPRDGSGATPVEPRRRTARRRATAPTGSPTPPAPATEAHATTVPATAKGLLQSGGGRTVSLALSIAAAQTAGTQIAGEDFVALVERVNQALLTL